MKEEKPNLRKGRTSSDAEIIRHAKKKTNQKIIEELNRSHEK